MAALDRPIATGLVSGSGGSPATTATAAGDAADQTQSAERTVGAGGIGWDAIVPVLGTVVTGAGLLGFVALFGGAIFFARADEAGLPAAQTVALLPKSTLLATGAEFLVGAMLLACAAVAALWLLSVFLDPVTWRFFDRWLRSRERSERAAADERIRQTEEGLSAHDAEAPLLQARLEELRADQEAREAAVADARNSARICEETLDERRKQAAGADTALAAGELPESESRELQRRVKEREEAERRHENSIDALRKASGALTAARADVAKAEKAARAHADETSDMARRRDDATAALAAIETRHEERAGGLTKAARYLILCLALLIAESLMLAAGDRVTLGHTLILIVVSVVTSIFAVLVYHETEKFVWFGVAVFLAIGVFKGWALNYSIRDDPRIEPVAALVKGQEPLIGAYLTQTKDRVYVGIPLGDNGKPPLNLASLDRGAVAGLSIARLAPPDQLKARASEMATALCARQVVASSAKELRAAPQCPATKAALANANSSK